MTAIIRSGVVTTKTVMVSFALAFFRRSVLKLIYLQPRISIQMTIPTKSQTTKSTSHLKMKIVTMTKVKAATMEECLDMVDTEALDIMMMNMNMT